MKRLPEGMELDRLIFLARMGTSTRLRAQTSGVIEITEESISSISQGYNDAAGKYGYPFVSSTPLRRRRPPANDTVTIDQYLELEAVG